MKKNKVLPILAFTGITKNKELYFPYFGAGIFSSFLYFTFDSILHHRIMRAIPKAEYAYIIMSIGFVLLSIIMFPFLHYTYRFVIKRRKKELGLYSILGLEKKHIAVMMIYESLITTLVMIVGGILMGMVFSKLVFLLLCYILDLPVLNEFPFSFPACRDTTIFFIFSAFCNLLYSLYTVGKSNPIELFADSRKGEKKPKFIWLYTLVGIVTLLIGYGLSITSKMDSALFGNFFFAVFLVIIGTYFLFTSGSVVGLGLLKKKKGFYYKPSNFITVSGMYYRMKRSAAGLVNICIFSTMVIITLSCTISLYFGREHIFAYQFPYDIGIELPLNTAEEKEALVTNIRAMEKEFTIEEDSLYAYSSRNILAYMEGNRIDSAEGMSRWDNYVNEVEVMTLEEYNQMAGEEKSLEEREIFIFSKGKNYNQKNIMLFGEPYTVKEEFMELPVSAKEQENNSNLKYWIVVKNFESLPQNLLGQLYQELFHICLNITGEEEECQLFAEKLEKNMPSLEFNYRNNIEHRVDVRVMYGGLLFIGIFFGMLFMICLLVIMHYKQITEGYEDRDNFEIMQKVGMGHEEVHKTIAKQVLLVFFLPIFGAVCHTMAAVPMTSLLMSSIGLYSRKLIVVCCASILCLFFIVYGISYLVTAKAYMRIVERKGN